MAERLPSRLLLCCLPQLWPHFTLAGFLSAIYISLSIRNYGRAEMRILLTPLSGVFYCLELFSECNKRSFCITQELHKFMGRTCLYQRTGVKLAYILLVFEKCPLPSIVNNSTVLQRKTKSTTISDDFIIQTSPS